MLPESHPAKIALDKIPFSPNVFSNFQSLVGNGFINKNSSGLKEKHWNIHVVSHPLLEGYLIKTFDITQEDYHYDRILPQYIKRILCAEAIRNHILENRFKHIIVPKKWLYRLPDSFKDQKSPYGKFLLIVEDMHIMNGCSGNDENSYHYYHMPEGHLYELLSILSLIKTYDAALQNIPFTRNNQLALIDTVETKDFQNICLKNIIPYLRPELQTIAKEYWFQINHKSKF